MIIAISSIFIILLLILCLASLIQSIILTCLKLLIKDKDFKYTYIVSIGIVISIIVVTAIIIFLCATNNDLSLFNMVIYLSFNIISKLDFLKDNFFIILILSSINFILQTILISFIKLDNDIKVYEDAPTLGNNECTDITEHKELKITLTDILIVNLTIHILIFIVIGVSLNIGYSLSSKLLSL